MINKDFARLSVLSTRTTRYVKEEEHNGRGIEQDVLPNQGLMTVRHFYVPISAVYIYLRLIEDRDVRCSHPRKQWTVIFRFKSENARTHTKTLTQRSIQVYSIHTRLLAFLLRQQNSMQV